MSNVLQHFLEPNARDLRVGYRIQVASKKDSPDGLAQLGWFRWVGYLSLLQAKRRGRAVDQADSSPSALANLIIPSYCCRANSYRIGRVSMGCRFWAVANAAPQRR